MLDFIDWDSKLVSRYGQARPDYAGYPQPTLFHRGVGSLDLLRALRSSRQAQRPLALQVQLPFGHGRQSCGESGSISPYLRSLQREIDLVACHLDSHQRVERFHLSGGALCVDERRWLMDHLRMRFKLLDYDAGDYSIELALAHTDWPTMGQLRELGFNRVSIGVPDLDAAESGTVSYFQSPVRIRSLIEAARALHYRSINVDLGYGRAWQTAASFSRKLAAIIELQPDRLSIFDYAHPPQRYATRSRPAAGGLSSPDEKLVMLKHCVEQLTAAGYQPIGMGLFVLEDDDLAMARENGVLRHGYQGYTRHGHCDQIGLGVSGISQIGDLYAQNTSDLVRYQEGLDMGRLATCRGLRCKGDDEVRRTVIERLLCEYALDLRSIETRFDLVFRDYFSTVWPLLEQMARDGLIVLADDFIRISAAGRLMVDAVCKAFEHDLAAPGGNTLYRSSASWPGDARSAPQGAA
jgi:oxygen-independent coproporphyrinogen-3 oxidase